MENWKKKPYPYWKNQAWYAKRNESILLDRKAGMTIYQIMEKYDICFQRVYEILRRAGILEKEVKKDGKDRK